VPAVTLTAEAVRKLTPNGVRQEIADSKAAGLYLVIQTSGVKSWAYRGRVAGKPVKITLGRYPKMDLTAARDRAGDARKAVVADVRGCCPVSYFCDPAVTTAILGRLHHRGICRFKREDASMTISTPIAVGVSAAALSFSLALAPSAFARDADPMRQDLEFRNSLSRYDGANAEAISKDPVKIHNGKRYGASK
jgi:pentapeptide MXKDX repeat protein